MHLWILRLHVFIMEEREAILLILVKEERTSFFYHYNSISVLRFFSQRKRILLGIGKPINTSRDSHQIQIFARVVLLRMFREKELDITRLTFLLRACGRVKQIVFTKSWNESHLHRNPLIEFHRKKKMTPVVTPIVKS